MTSRKRLFELAGLFESNCDEPDEQRNDRKRGAYSNQKRNW